MEERIPEGFRAEMVSLLGKEEAGQLLESLEGTPSVSVRRNPRKPIELIWPEGTLEEGVPWADGASYLAPRPLFGQMPELHGGAFYVQEAASMAPWRAVRELLKRMGREDEPVRVLDLCAAPGGKTLAVADALPEGSVVVANEYVGPRAAVLAENVAKWGLDNVIVTNASTGALAQSGLEFDLVIADVPCSGEGMMRKEAVARSQWSRRLVEETAALQRQILSDAALCMAEGGHLLYSTCTFNRQENEDQAEWLVREQGFCGADLPGLAGWFAGGVAGFTEAVPSVRFMPHRCRSEGLFLSVLRKEEGGRTEYGKRQKPGKPWKAPGEVTGWVRTGYEFAAAPDGTVRALPPALLPVFRTLEGTRGVRILQAGVTVAEPKGRDWSPAPALALSAGLNADAFPREELDLEGARTFLRGLAMPGFGGKGYRIMSYRGLALGFVKDIGNRSNNLWPKPWRI